MLKTDFIHLISDAVQQHEGWLATGGASYPNLNPGNLTFAEQPNAVANGRWAKFPTFWDGKQALNNDIGAKMTRLNTIRDIITEYAPQSQNDTEAYIASVCAFLLSRNVVLNPDSPIDAFLSQCQTPVILVCINSLWEPADWASIQASIVTVARVMPQYAFSTRYPNEDLSGAVVQISTSPIGQTSGLSLAATQAAIAPYNNGQPLNVMLYDGTIMQGHPTPVGGCEWQGIPVDAQAPVSAFASCLYNGVSFEDANAAIIFHELIHELFALTKQPDVLHADLKKGQGYAANAWVDLIACFTGNQLNTPAAIANLTAAERSIV